METGDGAATGNMDREMEAALDRAKVLTQTKTVIGTDAAAGPATDVVEAAAATAVTSTAVVVVSALGRPAKSVLTTAIGRGLATAAATAVMSVARLAANRLLPSPRSPRTIVTSEPSLCSRSHSVQRLDTFAISSRVSVQLSRLRLLRTALLFAQRVSVTSSSRTRSLWQRL